MPERATTARIWAALLIVYVVWGSTYLGILFAIESIPVLLMNAIRFLTAGALLYAWCLWRGEARAERPGRREWVAATIIGVLFFPIANTAVAWAETRVATGTASLVIATIPLLLALFDRVATGQRLSRTSVVGIGVGFVGAAILAGPGPDRIDIAGALVLLLSAVAWAAGSLYSRSAPLPRRPLLSSSMQMLTGGVVLAVIAAANGEVTQAHDVSAKSVAALAYLVVFGSLLAFTAYAWLLRNARTSLVGTYAYVNPLVAVFLGWAIESEPIGLRTVLAGALILGAVALIVTPPRHPPAERPAAVPARAR